MKNKLIWTAYSSKPRIEIIEKIKSIISSNDGYIMNFNMFSDLAMTLNIEIPGDKIIELHNTMNCILKISNIESNSLNQGLKKEWRIFINISFSRGKGELKMEIPTVPG